MGFHTTPNRFIKQVRLTITNLEKSLHFYSDFLGFKVLRKTEKEADLGVEGSRAILTLLQPDGATPKEARTAGLYHFAILLPSRKELGKFLLHMAKANYPLGAGDHLVSEALYFDDPDGNGIEVYCDRPALDWTWKGGQVEMAMNQLDAEGILAAGKGEQWAGMPQGTVMGHIHLHVAHLSEAAEFYSKAFGYEVVSALGNQAYFLSTGRYHHHIGLNTWNGVGVPQAGRHSAGLEEFILSVTDNEDIEKIKLSLKALHAPVEMSNGYLHTSDPSGNRIAIAIQ
ncbi:VOC family protein [Bacillus sp. 1P06AnD]|uniref:VOC family protein n=1 Tax=Bacillus sp. 1P06AnD TaxID=3132208 RepID=UPI00399EEC7E